MPLFEFVCTRCRHHFEDLVSSSQSSARCPKCASEQVKKQLSVFAVGGAGESASPAPAGGCGSCGDPRGPGACRRDWN